MHCFSKQILKYNEENCFYYSLDCLMITIITSAKKLSKLLYSCFRLLHLLKEIYLIHLRHQLVSLKFMFRFISYIPAYLFVYANPFP